MLLTGAQPAGSAMHQTPAKMAAPAHLPEHQRRIGCRTQRSAEHHGEAEGEAAGKRDQRRQGERFPRRFQRDHHADEANNDRRPAPPADLLAEQQRRHGGNVDRRGQPIGHGIGKRHVGDGEVESGGLEGKQRCAHEMQLRPPDIHEPAPADLPEERCENHHRGDAADQHELTDGIGQRRAICRARRSARTSPCRAASGARRGERCPWRGRRR